MSTTPGAMTLRVYLALRVKPVLHDLKKIAVHKQYVGLLPAMEPDMHEHTKHQKKAKRKTTNICRNKNLQR
jgi:hypothetical protein